MYNSSDRQMFDVNVSCGQCGTAITQLPFQPSGDRPVYCSNCLRDRRQQRPGGGGGGGGARRDRQMYDVDVECAECHTRITQLPFQPSGDRPIYCFECNKSRRGMA